MAQNEVTGPAFACRVADFKRALETVRTVLDEFVDLLVHVAEGGRKLQIYGEDRERTAFCDIAMTDYAEAHSDSWVKALDSEEIVFGTEGEVLLDASVVRRIIAASENDEGMTIRRLKKNVVLLRSGDVAYRLPLKPSAKIREYDLGDKLVSFTRGSFTDAIALLGYIPKKNTTRRELTGINMRVEATGLTLSATDGYRMASKAVESKIHGGGSFLVDARAMVKIARVFKTLKNQEIDVYSGDGFLHFLSPTEKIRLIELEELFPPVHKAEPASPAISLAFNREGLKEALERAAIVADMYGAVRLKFEKGEEAVTLTAGEKKGEAMVEKVETASVVVYGESLQELSLPFNLHFLLEPLRQMKSGDVKLSYSGPRQAVILTPSGEVHKQDTQFRYLFMLADGR